MSDELIVEPVLTTLPEVEVSSPAEYVADDAPKLSKYETEAIAKGWKPKDNFSGDLEEFRSAKEWLERGELLDTIHSQNREVKALKETVDHLAHVSKKVEENTRARTIAELEARHRDAVEIGDVAVASQVAKDMVKVHSEPLMAPRQGQNLAPETEDFIKRHGEWFNQSTAEHAAMAAFAVRRESEIAQSRPGAPLKEILGLVEADVKRTFPHKFAVQPASAVSAPSSAPSRSKDVGVASLPDFHQKMVKKLQRSIKDFDVKGYIKNLRLSGEIK